MEFVRGGLPDKNVFMMCRKLNPGALRSLPKAYRTRNRKKDELAMWTARPLEDQKEAKAYHGYYFTRVCGLNEDLFYSTLGSCATGMTHP